MEKSSRSIDSVTPWKLKQFRHPSECPLCDTWSHSGWVAFAFSLILSLPLSPWLMTRLIVILLLWRERDFKFIRLHTHWVNCAYSWRLLRQARQVSHSHTVKLDSSGKSHLDLSLFSLLHSTPNFATRHTSTLDLDWKRPTCHSTPATGQSETNLLLVTSNSQMYTHSTTKLPEEERINCTNS